MTCRICFPQQLNELGIADLSQRLRSVSLSDTYIFDVSKLERAYPFATLLAIASIRAFTRRINKQAEEQKLKVAFKVHGIDGLKPVHGYLGHIGFYQEIGVNFGKYSGEASGSDRYVPITHIKTLEILDEARKRGVHHGDVLIMKAEVLAKIVVNILKPDSKDPQNEYVFKVVAYTIREIMRNSIEHSKSPDLIVSAQGFPGAGRVEIAILDFGVGIHDTLGDRFGYTSPGESVLAALKPGVSSKYDYCSDNVWGNSGFGLYTTRRMCTYFDDDSFAIASSGVMYTSYKKDQAQIRGGLSHSGTAVMLRVHKHEDYYFENILENIVDEGESEAGIVQKTSRASKMSKLLR